MTLEEFKMILKQVVEAGDDQGRVTDLLTQISDDYGTTSARLAKLETENQSLRDTNMRLFLKVGEQPETVPAKVEDKPIPTFDDLFDENGKLK